ncbi:MAG: HlyD family efflux transporter periplasmic adaptor subunit [Acidobacteriota bacterium]
MLAIAAMVGCSDGTPPLAVGTLERHRIELRAERQEPVTVLAATAGESVQAGDLVVELDSRRITAQLDQARASRNLAAARLAEVVRGARQEEIDRARAQLSEAEATLIDARSDLERVRNLVAQGVEPQSVLDSAEAAFAAATARRDAAHAALERQLNGSTVEEHDQARAALEQTEAEVARLLVDVERMAVLAPVPGTVDALPFKVGDEPPVGAAVAVLLTDDAPFARVYIPAELRPTVAAGQAATVAVDGYPNPFEGRVRFVSSEAAFTPYYALTERDRGHFSYLAEIDLVSEAARDLPTGLPVEVNF